VNFQLKDNRILHYLIAILLSAAMIVLQYLLTPWMGGSSPVILLLMAPLISSLFGVLPGLLATVACIVGGSFFLIDPVYTGYVEDFDNQLRLGIFAIIGVSISIAGGMRRNALNKANASLQMMSQQIAERERAEAALLSSQQLSQNILQSIADGLISIDQHWTITYINRYGKEIIGPLYEDADSVIGANFWDAFPHDPADKLYHAYQQGMKDRQISSLETYYQPLDSWFSIRVYPSLEGGISIYFLDITEKKRTEQALEHDTALIHGIAEGSNALIMVQDMQFRYTYFNKAYQQVFEELWGTSLSKGDCMLERLSHWPDQQSKAEALFKRAQAGENFSIREEFGQSADQRRIFDLRFNPIMIAEKQVGVALILIDVTDQVRTEEKLKEHERELAESNRRKDEFLATLAHELRNPLAPIRTGLEVIKMIGGYPESIEKVRLTMERQTRQLISLVDDLMEISRITRGKLELRKSRILLTDIIQSAVESAQTTIDEAGVFLDTELPEQPIVLEADQKRLVQVIANLLNNAAQHTSQGGRISLSAREQGNNLLMVINDAGIGIPEGQLENIFLPFAQIKHPSKTGAEGLGIGLALVKTLVELHGGSVIATSSGEQKGSTFTVQLPLSAEKSFDDHGVKEIEQRKQAKGMHKVLVVDDNKAAADLLSMIVKMGGNEVRTAGDGRSACEIAEDFLPDIILMDLGMPIMDGLESARSIRKAPWGKNVKIIALTGWGQEEDKQLTRAAGFDAHLVKPVEPEVLQELLR